MGAIVKTAATGLHRKPSHQELPQTKEPPRPAAATATAAAASVPTARPPGAISGAEEDDLMNLLGELEDPAFQRYREEEAASDRAWSRASAPRPRRRPWQRRKARACTWRIATC